MMLPYPPVEVLRRYCQDSSATHVSALGQGNINDTFMVRTPREIFVLQRINTHVFPDPNILINNIQHLSNHLATLPQTTEQHWEDAMLIPALDGKPSVRDNTGALWRALSYIKESLCVSHTETALQAEQTGWALGHFHKRLLGIDLESMQVPLPGFHNLGAYINQYDSLDTAHSKKTTPDVHYCLQAIKENRQDALVLERTSTKQKLPPRIIHGDPKIANVLFSKTSGLAISLIDLDTVGPGLLQHDIGDCLRSVCNTTGEESDPEKAVFDLILCEMTLSGYFKAADVFLTHRDKELIYDGIKAITYELGLRFFMDYLQGGIYFKCKTPEATLHKAVVQFHLLRDIIAKQNSIQTLALANS